MNSPRRNRVTPSGELISTSAKGKWMGNRGCLHDAHGNILGRRWTTRNWVCCALDFNGWKRQLMSPGQYTELFFLDEVTALAAGHRPCATCRRYAYNRFTAALDVSTASALNQLLHPERTTPIEKRPEVAICDLPDGSILTKDGGQTFILKWRDRQLLWSPEGYRPCEHQDTGRALLITPLTVVAAFRGGYAPDVHPTASAT